MSRGRQFNTVARAGYAELGLCGDLAPVFHWYLMGKIGILYGMESTRYDFIIIGAGVAGLTAAQYGARSNLKTLVLENVSSGGQALNIMHLENYPGLYPGIPGSEFIGKMEAQAKDFGAVMQKTQVLSVDKVGPLFTVKTADQTFSSEALLLATGAYPRKLGIPGEDTFAGRGVSYCATCDGPFFRNKRVVVVGGGDSACDEATYLSTLAAEVTLVHRRAQLRAQKAVAERVLRNPKITVRFNTVVKEIRGTQAVESLLLEDTGTGLTSEAAADGVFIFAGSVPRTELVPVLPHDDGGFILTDDRMATPIPGLFCAGDVRSKQFRQVVTAAAEGALAAHSAEKYVRDARSEAYR